MSLSVGDIITLVKLVGEIIDIVNEIRGSSKKYSQLVGDLYALSSTLDKIKDLWNKELMTANETPLLIAIKQSVARCSIFIGKIIETITEHSDDLASGSKFRKVSWRIRWAFLMEKKLLKLHTRLTSERSTLDIYLSLWNCVGLKQVEQVMAVHAVTLRGISHMLRQLHPALGVPWDDTAFVWLIDVTGKTTIFPVQLCMRREIFHKVLEHYSRTRPGHRYIESGDYVLTSQENHQADYLIDPTDWEVRAGMVIGVKVVLRVFHTVKSCPSCRKKLLRAGFNNKSRCAFCDASLQMSSNGQEAQSSENSQTEGLSQIKSPLLGGDDDTSYIRRFHILFTRTRIMLNNYAVQNRLFLQYESSFTGPQNDVIWIAKAFINGQQYGAGQGTSRRISMESAALQALVTIQV